MTSMAQKIVFLPAATLAIAVLMMSCTSITDVAAGSGAETWNDGSFKLSGLTVDPGEVAARDEVVITAQVTNVSSVNDTYNAELKINDVTEASQKVSLPAGETQTLTFAIFKDAPGTYKVNLGPLASQFQVVTSVAALTGNPPAVSGNAGASCCSLGQTTLSPSAGQPAASCHGSSGQSSPGSQPTVSSGCGCRR